MEVTVVEGQRDEPAVVALLGQLDIDSACRLESTVGDLRQRLVTRIVLDLSQLSFCDSTGLSALVVAHNSLSAAGGFIRLAAPTPFLVRLLTVVGLLGRLPVYATVEAACAGDSSALLSRA
jgi:anti-sigma B factor antagonist